jgi:hypothetical protein
MEFMEIVLPSPLVSPLRTLTMPSLAPILAWLSARTADDDTTTPRRSGWRLGDVDLGYAARVNRAEV